MHPEAKKFLDNKAAYLMSDFAAFALHQGEHLKRRGIEFDSMPIAESLRSLLTIRDPWKGILQHLEEFNIDELREIDSAMSAGWPRAKVSERLEALESKEKKDEETADPKGLEKGDEGENAKG